MTYAEHTGHTSTELRTGIRDIDDTSFIEKRTRNGRKYVDVGVADSTSRETMNVYRSA